MCGINGIIDFENKLEKERLSSIIDKMNNSLKHRGPDDEGKYINNNFALGMRRLSIIDLEKGKQPIFNEDRTLFIFMNGEIYNYKTLREKLISKGHKIVTNSDTEVVIHLFEDKDIDCFKEIIGMFAIAIYDIKKNRLVLARDRAGEKPLYYFMDENYFIFSSELRGLISTGLIKNNIDFESLSQYLQLTYLTAPKSIIQGVKRVLPGQIIEIKGKKNIKETIYWDIEPSKFNPINDYDECKKGLREVFYKAVEETMVSDVPIGTFLSGGIDSCIITGLVSNISKKQIDSFSIGFKEKEFDESKRAILSAKKHKVNHHLIYLSVNDFLKEIDNIINGIDEPFADYSFIPTYVISKYASNYVKVVLTGDAGDELFGGYNKYLIKHYIDRYKKVPIIFRKSFEKIIHSLPDKTYLTHKIRKVLDNFYLDTFQQRKNLMCLGFKNEELQNLLRQNYLYNDSTKNIDNYYNKFSDFDEFFRVFYTDFKIVLEGDMLTKVDRASMLNSLETRIPMLHKDIVEYSFNIPVNYKIQNNRRKIILKDTFSDMIPSHLINANKIGFSVPIRKWFRDELKDELLKTLNKDQIVEQKIFNYEYIEKILNEHFSFKKDRTSELWTIYIFEKWYCKTIGLL
uniref:asparagine synthase (glutamine-hydrolyzing) n=1 Tax=candidate division WOR-3 bacterium TaxID=2052148 RepID=A0A7C3N9B9_UNCW3